MNNRKDDQLAPEIVQHDVEALHAFHVDRRDFMKLFGGGLVVCLCTNEALSQESRRRNTQDLPDDIASWLHIDEDGRVTVYTGKVELGQNIRTSLALQVAEELQVPIESITMVMADTALVPWDAGTFGSRTTPTMAPQLRKAAVAARETLLAMAAQRWSVQPAVLAVASGKVTNPRTQDAISYGELTRGQKMVKVIGENDLTPAAQWKVAGKSIPKVNGTDFVTGKHLYPSDIERPGLLHGKVLRPTGINAKLESLDTRDAEKIPGVKIVRDGDIVGVVAPQPWTAERAIEALHARWDVPQQPANKDLFEYLRKNADAGDEDKAAASAVEKALASADTKLQQTYTVQYIAHVPLEPRAAVAEWNGDQLTVWTGSQRPFSIREELLEAFHISPDKVRVIIPDTGSAYGGKHTGDAAVEAARLAKAAGKPVRLVWTREEEFTWAYVRPAGVIDVRSGATKDGKIMAWDFHNYNSGPAAISTPYTVAHQNIQFHRSRSPLRQGSYRALAATANAFARESHMDEFAHALGIDPLQFRLKNLDDPRLRAVFEAAAEKFGWGKQKPTPLRGFGIAGAIEKGGRVATCAEIEIDPATRAVRIRRVVEAFDCGAIVNPDGVRNQIAGAVVQAIGGALFEAVRFENGRILNADLSTYRVPRFSDMPEIEVVVLDLKDKPSAGAGETPILGLAPAVANAIFSATGLRLRALPLVPDGLPKATQKTS